MFLYRHKRATVWSSVLLGIPMILFAIPSEERAGGAFQIRAVNRVEMRAKVSGFLEEVWFDEGQPVSQGETIARLEIPDLESKIAQKQAEVKEGAYRLDLLVAGASELERNEQKARVERALKWCELAQADLDRFRLALADELRKLDQQINQYRSQRDFERDKFFLDDKLYQKGVIPKEEYLDSKKRFEVAQSQLEQAQSDKKARETAGTQAAEAELARRQKEHKEAEAMLSLMNAGTRKETIDAEQARQARLVEELKYLRSLEKKVVIEAPIKGKIILPRISAGSHENESVATRLHERVGQYFHEGDLICIIEDPTELEADIAVDEQESARVVEGQTVDLKVRALPFSTFKGSGQRVAPGAVPGEAQSTVHVYCRIENPSSDLKPGLSGHARLHCGRRQPGVMLLERGMRYLRTEVWW